MKRFENFQAMFAWLEANSIPKHTWGVGQAKSVVDLWSEYQRGETIFEDDPPVRQVSVVQLRIQRGDRILVELEQVLADGRRRARNRLPSEKMKAGESPIMAAWRCLVEELGLDVRDVVVSEVVETTETIIDSPSYPGLPTRYTFHTMEVRTDALPDGDFWRDNTAEGDPVRRHRWGWLAFSEWRLGTAEDPYHDDSGTSASAA
jgi:hypothetical protein